MTQEEKAKAYDEALEKAKKYHEEYWQVDAKDITETLFPQLCESEDERIRKYLIGELKTAKSVGELKFTIPQPTREECIAYLEKQKEQKPTLSDEGEKIRKEIVEHIKDQIDSFISAPDCRDKYEEEELAKYKRWIAYLEQEEQKPAEWNEKDKIIIEGACNALKIYGHTKLASMLESLRPQKLENF